MTYPVRLGAFAIAMALLAIGVLALAGLPPSTMQSAEGGNELIHSNSDANSSEPNAHRLRYRLANGSDQWDSAIHDRIVKAMDEAVAIYNANGSFDRSIMVIYSPQTPTADASYNGAIRFGGQIGTRTALHEIAHILGVGTHPNWSKFAKGGKWTGEYAIRQLQEFDGPDTVLHCDHQHFWPYGLNYDREGGDENFKKHVKMVSAFRVDLGIDPPPLPSPSSAPSVSLLESASVQKARADALAARTKLAVAQKSLGSLTRALENAVDSPPEVANAAKSAAAAKSAYEIALHRVPLSNEEVTDAKTACDAANAALSTARETALRHDPQWLAAKRAFDDARSNLSAANQALLVAAKSSTTLPSRDLATGK